MSVKLTQKTMDAQHEAGLTEILSFIRGDVYPFTPGISVHRSRTDGLMEDCLELVKRGLVTIHREDESRVDFAPVAQASSSSI